jgi:hypothetical protein
MKDAAKAIIASAAEAAQAEEAAAAAAAAQAKLKAAEVADKARRRKERAERKALGKTEDKEANKEKRLMKLVGAVVVKYMSKHSKSFDRDSFKKHAKDVCFLFLERKAYFVDFLFLADTNHLRQGKEIFKLSGRKAGRSLRGKGCQNQEICKGVHRQSSPQNRKIRQASTLFKALQVIIHINGTRHPLDIHAHPKLQRRWRCPWPHERCS